MGKTHSVLSSNSLDIKVNSAFYIIFNIRYSKPNSSFPRLIATNSGVLKSTIREQTGSSCYMWYHFLLSFLVLTVNSQPDAKLVPSKPAYHTVTKIECHIPEVVLIQLTVLMMRTWLLETCRELLTYSMVQSPS